MSDLVSGRILKKKREVSVSKRPEHCEALTDSHLKTEVRGFPYPELTIKRGENIRNWSEVYGWRGYYWRSSSYTDEFASS